MDGVQRSAKDERMREKMDRRNTSYCSHITHRDRAREVVARIRPRRASRAAASRNGPRRAAAWAAPRRRRIEPHLRRQIRIQQPQQGTATPTRAATPCRPCGAAAAASAAAPTLSDARAADPKPSSPPTNFLERSSRATPPWPATALDDKTLRRVPGTAALITIQQHANRSQKRRAPPGRRPPKAASGAPSRGELRE